MTTKDNFPWDYINYNSGSRLLWYNNPKCCSTTIKELIGSWEKYHLGSHCKFKLEKVNDYTSFGFVRNPYERTFSAYKMLKILDIKHHISKVRSKSEPNNVDKFTIYPESNFDKFVDQVCERKYCNDHIDPQVYYLPVSNDIKIDFIGKVENFNNDWMTLQEIINFRPIKNIKDIPKIQPKSLIKNLNSEEKKAKYESIKKEMNFSTMKKIQDFYKQDFIMFGYDFDDVGDFKIT